MNQAQCPSCPKNPQKGAVYYQDAGDKKKVWRANEHGVWEEVKFARSRVITPELLEAADKLNTTVNYLWGEGKTFTKVGSVKEIRAYYPDASAYTLEYKVTNQPDVYISVKNKRNKIIHLFTTPTPENIDFSFTFIKDTVVFANDNDINTTLRDLVDHFNEVQDLNPIIIVEGYANVTKLSDLNHPVKILNEDKKPIDNNTYYWIDLILMRADIVKKALIRLGIPSQRIQILNTPTNTPKYATQGKIGVYATVKIR